MKKSKGKAKPKKLTPVEIARLGKKEPKYISPPGSSSDDDSASDSGSDAAAVCSTHSQDEIGDGSEEDEEEEEKKKKKDDEEYSSDEDEGKSGYKRGGYHPVKIGDIYNKRYKVVAKLGWGHFSTVWRARDMRTTCEVALKIVKSAPQYTDAALDEIEILQTITAHDPSNASCCTHLLDHFRHSGPNGTHVCMVFEVLGSNLLDLIKLHNYRGIAIPAVKFIAWQVLVGLDYLHTTCGLIHTDLKPENVLLFHRVTPELYGGRRKVTSHKSPAVAPVPKAAARAKKPIGSETIPENPLAAWPEVPLEVAAETPTTPTPPLVPAPTDSSMPTPSTPQGSESPLSPATSASTPGETSEIHKPTAVSPIKTKMRSRTVSDVGQTPPTVPDPPLMFAGLNASLYKIKLADFGNANWVKKHFTDDIQTRQYRSPEVILGHKWGPPVDMWSMACLVFELLTGDFLFEPKSGTGYEKEDDHLAQIIELLGEMPKAIMLCGKHSLQYFTKKGQLRNIKQDEMRIWGLKPLLTEKYHFQEPEAELASSFMLEMLKYYPEQRKTANQMLSHPWLADVAKLLTSSSTPAPSSDLAPAQPSEQPPAAPSATVASIQQDQPSSEPQKS